MAVLAQVSDARRITLEVFHMTVNHRNMSIHVLFITSGSTEDALVPLPIESLSSANVDIVDIAAGYDHSLALSSTGQVYTWGRNLSGQLGHSDSYIDIYSMEDYPRAIDPECVHDQVFLS